MLTLFKNSYAFLSHFVKSCRGVSALEFALIAPIMISMYLGSVQATLVLNADRKLAAAVNTVANLVTQDDIITNAEMNGIFQASTLIMDPFAPDNLQVRVVAVVLDHNDDTVVAWSSGMGIAARAKDSAITIPDDLIVAGETVILVEGFYGYESGIGGENFGNLDLHKTVYLRPRITPNILRAN